MLGFVIPLAHPANMVSPERRAKLLSRTLKSVCRQNDREFAAIVVGVPEALETVRDDGIVNLLPVNFPPAGNVDRPTLPEVWLDKGAKVALGISLAKRLGCTHVMNVDSDDYVSVRLSSFVQENLTCEGWYFASGYVHISGTRSLISVPNTFHEKCGTSHIISVQTHPIPESLDPDLTRDQVVDSIGSETITEILGKHRSIVPYFHTRGVTLEKLPFAGAVWEIATGESFTGLLNTAGERVTLDASTAGEFGIEIPGYLVHATTRLENVIRRLGRRTVRQGSQS